jgi:hypothetical protein
MKRLLVLYLILLNFSYVFSQQDLLIKEIKQQTLKNDSLQKQVIKPLNDSIIKLNSAYKSKTLELKWQIKTLADEKNLLTNGIKSLELINADLNKNKVKVERDSFQIMVDSLSTKVAKLEKIISQKEIQIEKVKQLGERKAKEEKEKGKQEALHQIVQTYKKPFDELILSSSISSIERDLSIVGNNNEAHQNLLNLQKYFLAKQVISEKYNEQKVNSALYQIGSLDQTVFVKNLTDLLSNFKLCNAGLETTIENILKIDNQFVANDDYSQKKKLGEILSELAWYFRNYRFNFSDYPYLSDIVLEIIKQKQRDANTDISIFLDKL